MEEKKAAEQAKNNAHDAFVRFINTPLDELLRHGIEVEEGGEEEPKRRVLELFRTALAHVPAYKPFLEAELAKNNKDEKDLEAIASSWERFVTECPLINKSNYLQKYPLHQRCLYGRLSFLDFLHTSSGSSGQPTVWGRSLDGELDIATRFEQLMHDSFKADQKTTLCVICFPLGVWVGGLFTTLCVRYLACKGYTITVVTPGNNVAEILKTTQSLASMFEQTVLLGYPPFIKGVIDAGNDAKVPWATYNIKLVLAGEVFSEEWRNLVCERASIESPVTGVVSLYGTADAAVIGNETPLSVTIRRWLASNPDIARSLFGKDRLPTLIQYDPSIRFLEKVEKKTDETHREGEIVLTTLSSKPHAGSELCPVIRYDIGDAGGRLSFSQMMAFLKEHKFDAIEEVKKVTDRGCRPLPFAWVFGRAHWAISLFGANVYVENIMVGLERAEVNSFITGKFVLYLHTDSDNNPRVGVHVELVPGVEADEGRKEKVTDCIYKELLRLNSEFANYVPQSYQIPIVTLHPHGQPTYFPIGVKHRYTH